MGAAELAQQRVGLGAGDGGMDGPEVEGALQASFPASHTGCSIAPPPATPMPAVCPVGVSGIGRQPTTRW